MDSMHRTASTRASSHPPSASLGSRCSAASSRPVLPRALAGDSRGASPSHSIEADDHSTGAHVITRITPAGLCLLTFAALAQSPTNRKSAMIHVAEAPRAAAPSPAVRDFQVMFPDSALRDLKQ